VTDPKVAKNRLHLDVAVDTLPEAAVRAVELGARIGELVTDDQGSFQVMTDPEGNEFCLVTS
jgi:predicted enzyme related to lactoylglutathione lyase